MIDVTKGKQYILTAPYLINDVDATVAGTQVWAISNTDMASITPQADGSALLSAIAVGVVDISYTANGINAAGNVPLFGKETLNITEIVQEPVQVTINVKEVV